ncbi:hypothetical protein DVH24_015798 [Malus domestica]|uniref:Uncharacterized protein n=1 Tax=Malus domestica TaxID=3750 RepID=A0A498HI76_MALDO|nr:hypothetical protein DVH24_015798 [Malus domestica]
MLTKFCRHEIRPVQKFWTHSHKRVDKINSTNEFKCTVQVSPYLLTFYDAAKDWLTLQEQVT